MAAILPSAMPMSASKGSPPEPSTTVPPRITSAYRPLIALPLARARRLHLREFAAAARADCDGATFRGRRAIGPPVRLQGAGRVPILVGGRV